ncbi:MAG: DNA starvation/stationary phase protection protein [Alphaproteobacteria bacterium]|nr:DNA starvation/stationary phase protection protein [Alphaproteobacteria bacterium]
MKKSNLIGLDKIKSNVLNQNLNVLLANYMVFYQNARGFHWNIKGDLFFELHEKFEELYNDLNIKADEIAERILTLEGAPIHTFDDFIKYSKIKVVKDVSDGKKAVQFILEALQILIIEQRKIYEIAGHAADDGTIALMSDYVRSQEKLVWMYSAFLK